MLFSHRKTAAELNEIKDRVIGFLKNNPTERQAVNFILKEYEQRGLKTELKPKVIVSYGKSTAEIHHFPKNIKLKKGPIMLDIWAKHKKGWFVDLTWMLYKGKPDKKFLKDFNMLVRARNLALNFINRCLKSKYLPTYFEIDAIARSYLAKQRAGYAFQHKIGHKLGKKVHAGNKREYYERLKLNMPYTIEPGLYFKYAQKSSKFLAHQKPKVSKCYGIRLENNFWIDEKFKLHTKNIQNKLILI